MPGRICWGKNEQPWRHHHSARHSTDYLVCFRWSTSIPTQCAKGTSRLPYLRSVHNRRLHHSSQVHCIQPAVPQIRHMASVPTPKTNSPSERRLRVSLLSCDPERSGCACPSLAVDMNARPAKDVHYFSDRVAKHFPGNGGRRLLSTPTPTTTTSRPG